MKRMRALLSWGLVASVCLIPYKGWSQNPPPQPPPPIDKIDVDALQSAVKAALNCGASYLLRAEETNQVGFFYPPTVLSNVVSYKETKIIEEHWRIDRVEIPIYKPIYESYETFAVGGGDSAAGAKAMRKVTKNRLIGQEKIGTTNIEKYVRDEKGPIVRNRTIYVDPVFEKNTYWPDGFWGMNGISLYILVKCGYWDKTNALADVAKNMANTLDYGGLPDMTFDVAWLAAAFANIPDKRFEKIRDKLINKLLDGQIVEGPARGLWGPVCIRGETLAAMIAYEQSLGRALAKAKEKLKAANDQSLDRAPGRGKVREKPGIRSRENAVSDAEGMLKDFQRSYLNFAQQGTRFEDVTKTFVLEDKTIMLGLPYYIYNQTLGDMESTALALFAIHEAADNRCLPDEVAKPTGAQNKVLIAQEKTSAIMARAAAGIAALQQKDGSWDECNIHQPLTAFLPLGLPTLESNSLMRLSSPTTMLSVVQGYAALMDIGGVVGQDNLYGKYKSVLDTGEQAGVNKLQAFADKPAMKGNAMGRLMPPYDLLAKAASFPRTAAGSAHRDLWLRLAFFLVNQQKDDGSWRNPASVGTSSSLLAYWDEMQRQAHELRMARLDQKQRIPFNPNIYRSHYYSILRLVDGHFLSTAYAMLYLLGEVREPVIGYYAAATDSTTPAVVAASLDVLGREKGIPLTSLRVTAQTPLGVIMRLPILFINGATLPDDSAKTLIGRYAYSKRFLIIEKPATANADWENKWATIVGANRAGNVPETVSFLQGLPFKPEMRGLYDAAGQLAAVFLPAMTQTQGGSVAPNSRVATTAAAIIRTYVDPSYFDSDYPIKMKGFTGDPFVARVASLDLLASMVKSQQAQMPDRAASPAARPPAVSSVAETNAVVEKPAVQDDLLETTEEGIPIPKPKESAPPKADEVW